MTGMRSVAWHPSVHASPGRMLKPIGSNTSSHRSLMSSYSHSQLLYSIWNVMADGDAQDGKWRGNWRMEWVASTLHTTSEHGVSSITTAEAHTSSVPVVDWNDVAADLNGLLRFGERQNLVSACVPSHFKWPLRTATARLVYTNMNK